MAFGKVDSVTNHVTGERKAITTIDMDKEYGLQGYGIMDININDVMKHIESYRKECVERVSAIDPSWGSKDYYQLIIAGNPLKWNIQAISESATTFLGTMAAHLERIVESKKNPLNNL